MKRSLGAESSLNDTLISPDDHSSVKSKKPLPECRGDFTTKPTLLWYAVIIWVLMTIGLILWANSTASAADMSKEEVSVLLRDILKENPEIVLDVLREHSEIVLDIAQDGSNQRRRKALVTQWKLDMAMPKHVDLTHRPTRGPANAPVTLVAFSDFTCPYCAQANTTVQQLLKTYDGKIRYVFKHFPLEDHGPARIAAEYHVASALQDVQKSWTFYDLLFSRREEILKNGEAAIKRAAEDAGLDMYQLAHDLRSDKVNATIEADMTEAAQLGIQGTPYFLVNNLVVRGALAPDFFAEAVKMALGKN